MKESPVANADSSSSHSLRLLFVGLLLIGSEPLGFSLSRLDVVCVKLVYELWREAEVSINHTVITEGQTPRSPFRIWTSHHGSSANVLLKEKEKKNSKFVGV